MVILNMLLQKYNISKTNEEYTRLGLRVIWFIKIINPIICVSLIVTLLSSDIIFQNIWLILLGVFGAFFANATGVGGGIIFVPAFYYLGLSNASILTSSILIQCFGMTMGSMAYQSHRLANPQKGRLSTSNFYFIAILVSVFSSISAALCLHYNIKASNDIIVLFKYLSLILGCFMLFSLLFGNKTERNPENNLNFEIIPLIIVGIAGGVLVSWISIGVGELLAVYLILRRYDAVDAIGLAVVTTSVTVLCCAFFIWDNPALRLDIALMVAPGAIIGGYIARLTVTRIGANPIKWLCTIWILLSAVVV